MHDDWYLGVWGVLIPIPAQVGLYLFENAARLWWAPGVSVRTFGPWGMA